MRECELVDLKSNMDRFIEAKLDVIGNFDSHLKSNMDRFIVGALGKCL